MISAKLPLIFALLSSATLISVAPPVRAARLPSPVRVRGGGDFWDEIRRGLDRLGGRRDYPNEGQSNITRRGLSSSSTSGDGALYVSLGIGTPAMNVTLVFDTTSDLLWTQCQPCLSCVAQAGDMYAPNKSQTFANLTGRSYNYTYSKHDFTSGYLATETFALGNNVTVANITFGCGTRNQGYYDNVAGVFGVGRGGGGGGGVSLLNQLGIDRFSYCFSSSGAPGSSAVFLGGSPELATNTTTTPAASTPMVADPVLKSGYFVKLVGVTVGATRVDVAGASAEGGGRALVIDSTSLVTVLDEATYGPVRRALVAQLAPLKEANANASAGVGLDLCFELPAGGATATTVPNVTMTLHFDGGGSGGAADLVVPQANYLVFVKDSASGLLCLTMMPSSSNGVPVLGSWALLDTLVLYDLAKNVVSFQPLNCAAFLAATG
uniref:Peptidase A1 domain-containing protein n=1 Tax=Oryza meridionalis TaxID=40149 RepID=A0A0E0EUS4_9ORYZ